jgi:hypothetical protein
VLWGEGTLLVELNQSDWFGNRPDRFGVHRNRSDRFQNWSDRFGASRRTGLVFVPVMTLVLFQEVAVLMVDLESLQEVSLLGILHLVLNMGIGGVVALRWRRGKVHGLPFMVLVLQLERVGSHIVATVVVFVEVVLIGDVLWIILTPLWSKLLSTGFTLLVLNPSAESFVYSHAHF